jgi:Phage capsid family
MNEVLQDLNVYQSLPELLEDVIAVENSERPRRQAAAVRRLELHETAVRNYMIQRLPPEMRSASGMSEAVPADGGFLLAPQWARQIIERAYQETAVLRRVTNWDITDTNTNALKFPAIDETSRADGSRFGGCKAYWANEADAGTDTKPRFTNVDLTPKKIIGVSYLTSELLADMANLSMYLFGTGAPVDLRGPSMAVLVKEAAFRITDAIISGDGAGKPQGVLGTPSAISVTRIGGNLVQEGDITAMLERFWVGSRTDPDGRPINGIRPGPKPAWFCHCDVITQLAICAIPVGTGGSLAFLYNPETGIMMGFPVIPIEQCQALGTKGDLMLTDFNEYHLAWRKRGVLDVSMHVKFTTDQQAIRLVFRVDGNSGWNSAVTPLTGTKTQSPFVILN